ncbi:MAG: hypothetical protein KDA53_08770 [Hyphomonas sp.]|nr:hypothetical protein [Hyphomonas sp.]
MIIDPEDEETREKRYRWVVFRDSMGEAELARAKTGHYAPEAIRAFLDAAAMLSTEVPFDGNANGDASRLARRMLHELLSAPALGDTGHVEGLAEVVAVSAPRLSSAMSISGVADDLMHLAGLAAEWSRPAIAASLMATAVDVDLRIASLTFREDMHQIRLNRAASRLEEARARVGDDAAALAALDQREARLRELGRKPDGAS